MSPGPPRPGKFRGNWGWWFNGRGEVGMVKGTRGVVASPPSFRHPCAPLRGWVNTYFSRRSRTWLALKSGANGEQGLDGGDRGLLMLCTECLRLRLRSRPWCSPLAPEHTLALLRSRHPLGGGSAVSSPSSSLSATWKSRECPARAQTSQPFTVPPQWALYAVSSHPVAAASVQGHHNHTHPKAPPANQKMLATVWVSQTDTKRSTDVTRRPEKYFVIRWSLHPAAQHCPFRGHLSCPAPRPHRLCSSLDQEAESLLKPSGSRKPRSSWQFRSSLSQRGCSEEHSKEKGGSHKLGEPNGLT